MAAPTDFRQHTRGTPEFQDSGFVANVRYVDRLPSSVKIVTRLDREVLISFMHDAVDAVLVRPDAVTKRAVAAELRRAVDCNIELGEYPHTFVGRRKYFNGHFNNPESPLYGREKLQCAIKQDLDKTGNFLKQVRECCGTRSDQFWAAMLNQPCLGSLFHLHPGQVFAVRSYRGAGTEFLVSRSGEIFQLRVGDMMIFKGDRVIHRQPPSSNPIRPYSQGHGYDDRLLLSMAVTLGGHGKSRL